MKACNVCNVQKETTEFYKDSSRKDGFSNRCKECDTIQHNKYIETHPEYKEKSLKKLDIWTENNKERLPEINRKWRAENKDKINEVKKIWKKNNPEVVAAQQFKDGLKRKYGLTVEQYQQMIKDQDNKCKICGHEMNGGRNTRYAINIDHKHDGTKNVRSLLCNCCNKVIGYAYEDVSVLASAIEYLKFHSNKETDNSCINYTI